ncbi:hypothetical protein JOD45_002870 [Scopulibacillus daqui]|uniref:Uncharacterized protein n=1 Tax=Scopulibacillus daqui TaxID=1469162 RepID=A0ABS2Q2W3_9BACL|nr:hypothetical protein [Scopulibacillus daqui]
MLLFIQNEIILFEIGFIKNYYNEAALIVIHQF